MRVHEEGQEFVLRMRDTGLLTSLGVTLFCTLYLLAEVSVIGIPRFFWSLYSSPARKIDRKRHKRN